MPGFYSLVPTVKTLTRSTNLKLDFYKPGAIVSHLQSNDKHRGAIRRFCFLLNFFWHCSLWLSLLLSLGVIPLCKMLPSCYKNICSVKLNTVHTAERNARAVHR